jgi:uncharacterized membrane protein
MKTILIRLRSFFNTITGSIAFYPTFYAISAIIFALLMKWMEDLGASKYLEEVLPSLLITNVDTARNIITTLIAGGISILVFSFSMVMLLLSQAASNYSPRVLPSLISNRKHQYILGTFLASILYNIITVIGIDEGYSQLPGFSVLLGMLIAIIALAAFVYFIHSISSSIQINNILENIYTKSADRLKLLIANENQKVSFPSTDKWHLYRTTRSGTIQNISTDGLKEAAQNFETKFELFIIKGQYILHNEILFKSKKELSEDQLNEVYKNFRYSESELVSDNYVLGFKQITEIGIKAMSPGINDPGTAMDTIDYLSDLVRLRMLKQDYDLILDRDENVLIRVKVVEFDALMYYVFAAYRKYCKGDLLVMQKLLQLLSLCMKREACQPSYYDVLHHQATLMIHDAREAISNEHDLDRLKLQMETIDVCCKKMSES